jgi:hypothetical protein
VTEFAACTRVSFDESPVDNDAAAYASSKSIKDERPHVSRHAGAFLGPGGRVGVVDERRYNSCLPLDHAAERYVPPARQVRGEQDSSRVHIKRTRTPDPDTPGLLRLCAPALQSLYETRYPAHDGVTTLFGPRRHGNAVQQPPIGGDETGLYRSPAHINANKHMSTTRHAASIRFGVPRYSFRLTSAGR